MCQEETVAIVIIEPKQDRTLGVRGVCAGISDRRAIVASQVVDLDILQAIFTTQGSKGRKRLAGLECSAEIRLAVDRAQEGCRMVVELAADGDLVTHEPWLGERHREILTLETILSADTETLAGTGEVGPVEKIKIGLLKFGKSDQAIDGAEAGTKVERSGLFLINDDIEIFASRHQGIDRHGVDFREIIEIHQAGLADVDQRGVENTPRLDGQLATDHLVLGLRIALNIDEVHIGLNSLVDTIGEIDLPLASGGDLRLGDHIDIATGAVVIADFLQIGSHAIRGIERSGLHLEVTHQICGRHDGGTIDGELVDSVLSTLGNGNHQVDTVALGERRGLDIGDPHISKSLVLVEIADCFLVLVHLRGSEASCLGEEGEQVGSLSLHHLQKIFRKDRVIPREGDASNNKLRSLIDEERDLHLLIWKLCGLGVDLHIGEILILVEFEDLLAVIVDTFVTEGFARLGCDFLADF